MTLKLVNDKRPLLSLVMIVKDEAATIKAVLESVKAHVDHWTILDTGSTDGTQQIIEEVMKDISGTLFEEPFVDFATSRNRVMELNASEGTEFNLMLSGDEYLRNGEQLRAYLEEQRDTKVGVQRVDCHMLRLIFADATLFTPRILRTGSDWKYEGVIHEVPCNRVDDKAPVGSHEGAVIEHIVSDPEKRLNFIWEVHVPLLRKLLEENPNDERALIFLAQSYDSLMNGFDPEERKAYAAEAVDLYRRRLAIPTGGEVERNYVMMHCIDDARISGLFTDAELFAWVDSWCKEDPHRPETALLRVELAMKVVPLTRVYELAVDAARIAVESYRIVNSSPVTMSCGWKANYLAATAARQLAVKYPKEFGHLVKEHVTAGLSLGGSWDVFKIFSASSDETPPSPSASA